ncbi:MAG: bacterial Ig-like domain-containing protein, partial [Clostridia bacterium]|nr:bacterial Ig-like domain-containing protein [Clostridia bacterium]
LSGYDMSVVGAQTVTVTYRGHTLTYDITVTQRPEPTEVILLSGPDKTEFVRDTTLDYTGAKAQINYSDGSFDIVDLTPKNTTGADITKSGTYTVVYDYKGLTVSFTVKVTPVKVVTIRVETMPDKVTYLEGEELDTTGLVVVADYNNGVSSPISGYTLNYSKEAGEQTVTVKYQVFTCTFNVTFEAITAQTLTLVTMPEKTVYFEGETFDPTGMQISATYNDGSTVDTVDFGFSDITVTADDGTAYLRVFHDGVSIDIPLHVHIFGDWYIYTPGGETTGEERRECNGCDYYESREISNEVSISINNYWVYITGASDIKDMRYAPGEHTTTNSIRNDPNNVALSNKVVTANTVNGVFCYSMPKGGYYTIWVRMNDGTNHILPLDMTHFTPSVTAYGVKLTMRDLYEVKDIFIAKGEYNSYNEIKAGGYIVRLTENKIADKHNYTYTVTDPGMHTVLIRYNDGTEALFHKDLVVTDPTFETNGLQVTVGNIADIKVIRTAYGEYNTPGDTKRAEGARNFSSKVIGGAEEYMLQYRDEGVVTIVVEYNNGYINVFHYDVVQKTPTMEQNGNTVTFGDLDGLKMIRYAEGEYTTSNQIKNAEGSRVCKPEDMIDGYITVTLTEGTYTFCVQYDDESYNYYTVVVE